MKTPFVDVRKLVEASAWRVRLADAADAADAADEGDQVEQFERWLAEDERHSVAWRRVNGPWQLFGDHSTAPEIIAARRAALACAHQAGRSRWQGMAPHGTRARIAIAASLLIAAGIAFLSWQNTRYDVYSTGISERHSVRLADGSTVSLDAQSEVHVRFSAQVRDLRLIRGQAKFEVAHDVGRPFSVVVSGRKVIATGTAFNVDLLDASLSVTLIEGRVVVQSDSQGRSRAARRTDSIELTPGKQLIVAGQGAPTVTDVNVDLATAWQTGAIVFEDETLAEAAARLNRYSEDALIVADDGTGRLKISGVFKAGDLDGFVSTVAAYLPVHAQVRSDGDVEISRRLD